MSSDVIVCRFSFPAPVRQPDLPELADYSEAGGITQPQAPKSVQSKDLPKDLERISSATKLHSSKQENTTTETVSSSAQNPSRADQRKRPKERFEERVKTNARLKDQYKKFQVS